MALAPDGNAVAAWLRHDADGRWPLQYTTRPAGGTFRAATPLPGSSECDGRLGARVAPATLGGPRSPWTRQAPGRYLVFGDADR
ncbi:hypothetical protein FSW04_13555 [Baekduia soli]|uniref:Uncharacterized protein n=1 Tax=Baekduia soli TaxID=496014 RepID=A0A5B8U642_9ACTN|nr:hypothetical protein [Baekduia soli]QEC48490.1 hypothetical protein FSW04_13555 [Baekduia soli]